MILNSLTWNSMNSPTQRSLKLLRDNGYTVAIVEKYNFFTHRRLDLFSIGDLLAIKETEPGCLLIQTTTSSNVSAHVHKYMEEEEPFKNLKTWLMAGNRFVIHGWSKKGPRGKRKTWEVTRKEFLMNDLEGKDESVQQGDIVVSQKEDQITGGYTNGNEKVVLIKDAMGGNTLCRCGRD